MEVIFYCHAMSRKMACILSAQKGLTINKQILFLLCDLYFNKILGRSSYIETLCLHNECFCKYLTKKYSKLEVWSARIFLVFQINLSKKLQVCSIKELEQWLPTYFCQIDFDFDVFWLRSRIWSFTNKDSPCIEQSGASMCWPMERLTSDHILLLNINLNLHGLNY